MTDVVELYQHWHGGCRIGELCSSLGVDSKTVHKYVAPALAALLAAGTLGATPPPSGGVADTFADKFDQWVDKSSA